MRNKLNKGNIGKGQGGGGGSGMPSHHTLDKRLCINVKEVAAMLGLSPNFVYELVKQGQLPVIIFGKRKLIPRLALEKMLEKAGME